MKRTLSRSLVLVLLLGSMLYSTAQDFSTIPSDEESAKALAYLGYATQAFNLMLTTQSTGFCQVVLDRHALEQ